MANPDKTACVLLSKGSTKRCIQLWPGDLEKYCDGCIEYVKEKVIEKYRAQM